MSTLLQQAIASLNLQPGQTYRTTVNGQEVEVRLVGSPARPDSAEHAADVSDVEMIDLWLDVPPSPAATTLTVTRGEPLLPAPMEIDESDLAPE